MAVTYVNDPIPFAIDGEEFDRVTSAPDGEWEDDARLVTTLEAPQTYEVVLQPVPGFKTITQATEPDSPKQIHVVIYTFTKDDRDFMDSLDNYKPHEVQCHLFTSSPILMYLQSKNRRVYRTGMQQFALEWDLKLIEANDNN